MAGLKFLNVVALAAIGGATAYAKRDELKRTEAWKRGHVAIHVLRGRPLVWRVNLQAPPPPPLLHLADDNANVLIADTTMRGYRAPDNFRLEV